MELTGRYSGRADYLNGKSCFIVFELYGYDLRQFSIDFVSLNSSARCDDFISVNETLVNCFCERKGESYVVKAFLKVRGLFKNFDFDFICYGANFWKLSKVESDVFVLTLFVAILS